MNSHRDPEEKTLECVECHKKFWTKEKLARHAASHGFPGGEDGGPEGGEIKEGKGKRFEVSFQSTAQASDDGHECPRSAIIIPVCCIVPTLFGSLSQAHKASSSCD